MNSLISIPEGSTPLDVLALRYRAASEKTKAGRAQWIEGTLELAVVIAEAKRQPELASPTNYNRWLLRNGLETMSDQNRSALNKFAEDLVYARQLLEQSTSTSPQQIWRDRPNKPIAAPSGLRKGRIPRSSHDYSGSRKRSRRNRIPTVMQEDNPEPAKPAASLRAVRTVPILKTLTRTQVDPDFKGTPLEFATKYGHVTLQTKDQIEHNKRQEALQVWLGAIAEHERSGRAVMTAFAGLDPATLCEWLGKPGKIEKFKAWRGSIELASESVHRAAVLQI